MLTHPGTLRSVSGYWRSNNLRLSWLCNTAGTRSSFFVRRPGESVSSVGFSACLRWICVPWYLSYLPFYFSLLKWSPFFTRNLNLFKILWLAWISMSYETNLIYSIKSMPFKFLKIAPEIWFGESMLTALAENAIFFISFTPCISKLVLHITKKKWNDPCRFIVFILKNFVQYFNNSRPESWVHVISILNKGITEPQL